MQQRQRFSDTKNYWFNVINKTTIIHSKAQTLMTCYLYLTNRDVKLEDARNTVYDLLPNTVSAVLAAFIPVLC